MLSRSNCFYHLLKGICVQSINKNNVNPRYSYYSPNKHIFNIIFVKLSQIGSVSSIKRSYDASINFYEKDLENTHFQKLQEMLKCTFSEAKNIMSKCPKLSDFDIVNIEETLNYLMNSGVSKSTIQRIPFLLTFTKEELAWRLHNIKTFWPGSTNKVAVLLTLPVDKIKKISSLAAQESNIIPQKTRINYLSEMLQCSISDICDLSSRYFFIHTVPFARLSSILKILLDAGVTPEDILKDVWVFRYNLQSIQSRLDRIKESGIIGIKPWMVHCDMKILEIALQRRSDSKAVLGDQSIQEYLCKRLNCSEAAFRYMTKKQPAILKVHVTKLQETLDFLFEEGFSSNQVQQMPRVLCHSLATIQMRLTELRDLGYNPISLSILCKSLHEYSEFKHKMSGSRKQIAL